MQLSNYMFVNKNDEKQVAFVVGHSEAETLRWLRADHPTIEWELRGIYHEGYCKIVDIA